MLIFTIGIIALSSGCSQTRKIQGVWQLTGETVNGTSITLPDFITTYYCFTKKNLMYIAIKSGSGLKRSEPIAYTVDGNKLIISTGEGSPLVIKGKTATITDESKNPNTGQTHKKVTTFTKVSSPTLKEIEKAPKL